MPVERDREVVLRRHHDGMVSTQRVLLDFESRAKERFRRGDLGLLDVYGGEVGQKDGVIDGRFAFPC